MRQSPLLVAALLPDAGVRGRLHSAALALPATLTTRLRLAQTVPSPTSFGTDERREADEALAPRARLPIADGAVG